MEQTQFNFEMTGTESLILKSLGRGRANAVPVKVISEAVGLDGRDVRDIIRHLIMEHKVSIASSTKTPFGFYLLDTPGEAGDAIDRLAHRGISILARAAKLKGTTLEEIFGQQKLKLQQRQSNANY